MKSHLTYLLLFTFVFISILTAKAQKRNFEAAYKEIFDRTRISAEEALARSDSLYNTADTDEERIRSLLLKAEIYKNNGEMSDALYYIFQAKQLANVKKLSKYQISTSGMLASYFRVSGLYQEAKNHLSDAERAVEEQKDSPTYFLTKGNIAQEKGFVAQNTKDYNTALTFLTSAEHYFRQITDSTLMQRSLLSQATNDRLAAVCYLSLGDLQRSDSLINASLQKLSGKESILLPQIYRIKAELFLARQQYDSAHYYLQLIEKINATSESSFLTADLYETYAKYYQAIGKLDLSILYRDKYRQSTLEQQNTGNRVLEELYIKLGKDKEWYVNQVTVRNGVIALGCMIFIVFMVFVFFKRGKDRKRFMEIISSLNRRANISITKTTVPEVSTEKNELAISEATENRILLALEQIEKTDYLLNKEMSLATLATRLDTNERYVSLLVKKHRSTDFKNYLQHFRINYILKRLETEPELLNYKLSYLAEISGFSSHSKFSAVFKGITGISPSTFIKFAREHSTTENLS
ncbi:helix-turn-helix domain-containing protein [Sphingobacterium sp. Mn56C]|uniref:helix-turn-helix domain-containing protein n=1 Tax=Sphingobacterium sp. Mn56C TaxID=3395261 RepID=UPI003BE00C17